LWTPSRKNEGSGGVTAPQAATLIFVAGVVGLFVLDYDRRSRTSAALWIPIFWILLAGSRSLQDWSGTSVTEHTTDEFLRSRFVEGNPLDRNVITALLFFGLLVLFRRREAARHLVQAMDEGAR
jgi:hypothetical protein